MPSLLRRHVFNFPFLPAYPNGHAHDGTPPSSSCLRLRPLPFPPAHTGSSQFNGDDCNLTDSELTLVRVALKHQAHACLTFSPTFHSPQTTRTIETGKRTRSTSRNKLQLSKLEVLLPRRLSPLGCTTVQEQEKKELRQGSRAGEGVPLHNIC